MITNHKLHQASALALLIGTLASPNAMAETYWLRAAATSVAMPNPNGVGTVSVPMWGYALCTANFDSCGTPSVPGPALTVTADSGGTVNSLEVHLQNSLTVPTSLVVNGLVKPMQPVWTEPGSSTPLTSRTTTTARVRSFDAEAAAGGSAVYIWSNVKAGTYLYQSGTQPQVQVQMGLYGAVAKNAVDPVSGLTPVRAEAYAGMGYDNVATLLYSEVDPVLHNAVAAETYGKSTGPTSTIDYAPKYFLINGQPYPGNGIITPQGNAGRTLVRLLNAGLTTRVPTCRARIGMWWPKTESPIRTSASRSRPCCQLQRRWT